MKILFFDPGPLSYSPQTPFEQPLGGSESAAAYLTAALAARGHEISLANRSPARGLVHGVRMEHAPDLFPDKINNFDVVICVSRPYAHLLRNRGALIPIVNWEHLEDRHAQIAPFSDLAVRKACTTNVFVSDHQAATFAARFGMTGSVIRNAASPAVVAQHHDRRTFVDNGKDPVLIYSSSAGRGLDLLLAAFASIREDLPDAQLWICEDGETRKDGTRHENSALFALAKLIPGVRFLGRLSQVDMAQQLAQADILAYPCDFQETSCIVAIEAAISGCLFIGMDRGALTETMDGHGVFMPFIPSRLDITSDFAQLVVTTVVTARASPEAYRERLSRQNQAFRSAYTWDRRASEWETWLTDLLHTASNLEQRT